MLRAEVTNGLGPARDTKSKAEQSIEADKLAKKRTFKALAELWLVKRSKSPSLNADSPGIVSAAGIGVMATPAWSVPGAIEIVVTYFCRKRCDHKRVFRTIR